MLTFEKFTGINNVLPTQRLSPSELTEALNVDIGLSGEIMSRSGYAVDSTDCSKNLWQADGFMLATCTGDLRIPGGAVLYPSLGVERVWYCNLPDGRTTFSNGLINGITDGTTATGWGVPVPTSLGGVMDVAGSLFPGDYQYQLTYVRLADKRESGPIYSNPIPIAAGGMLLSGLPTLAGHSINVYITGQNGDEGFYAGNTTLGVFTFTGKNDTLTLPCRTGNLLPMPVGTVTAFWRGRALVAVGNQLIASRTHQVELHDPRRDFKQFSDTITLIQPVDDGVYVGTTTELAFLAGDQFDKLVYRQVIAGGTVLGSGVTVSGELLKLNDSVGAGTAMVCIADSIIVYGFNGGNVVRVTEGRYETTVTEVAATFRVVDGIPQYIAIPQ